MNVPDEAGRRPNRAQPACGVAIALLALVGCASSHAGGGSGQGSGGSNAASTGGSASRPASEAGAAASGGTVARAGTSASAGGSNGAWTPPFPVASTAWHESTRPLCTGKQGIAAGHGIWSDARGVYVLASVNIDSFQVGEKLSLQFNDGSGWKSLLDLDSSQNDLSGQLRGMPDGALIYAGATRCGIQLFDPGTKKLSCAAAISDVNAVTGVSAMLAYALSGDRVLSYDGANWTQAGNALEPGTNPAAVALFADTKLQIVTAAASFGSDADRVYLRRAGESDFSRLAEVPPGYYGAVWAFSERDIWLGELNQGALVHYDGAQWTRHEVRLGAGCIGVMHFWGQDGVLYFLSEKVFGRVNAQMPEVLAEIACEEQVDFADLWGNGINEVFIAVRDQSQDKTTCGPSFALWWDGKQLNRL